MESYYPQSMEGVPETEPPIQYTLPFRWGTLRVSEAAHQAYGFTPLVEGKIDGSHNELKLEEEEEAAKLRVDVWMLSPDELRAIPALGDAPEDESKLITVQRVHPEGVAVVQGLTKDRSQTEMSLKESMENDARSMFSEIFGEDIDLEEITAENMMLPGGITLEELIERNITQQMMQVLCSGLSLTTGNAIRRWIKHDSNEYALNKINRAGKIALIGTGLVLAGTTAVTMDTPGNLDNIMAASFTLGFLASNFRDLRKHLRSYMKAIENAEPLIYRQAELFTQKLASDIANAYSTEYFDEQNKGLLEGLEGFGDSFPEDG